ncbi:30 kda heat shock protein [Diplodia corticola]|uniref:30 kDa heat shock protein n=1 Tax=Diplodia corticola TaxID=236234 RepID=A0A1J9R6D1_9PEZI|nr:30 kda heat shock protein [Diplodia corticola]OJD35770.1 30 kda heat shock protein [Diplodia corticola]
MARLSHHHHRGSTATPSPSACATATQNHKQQAVKASNLISPQQAQQAAQLRRSLVAAMLKDIGMRQQKQPQLVTQTTPAPPKKASPGPQPCGAPAVAIQQRLRSRRRDALAPDFDVRETESAFYLEGELPGVADRGAVRLDWTDRRTLSIDAKIEKVDLEMEWGLLRPIRVGNNNSKPAARRPSTSASSTSMGASVSSTCSSGSGSGSSSSCEDNMVVDEQQQQQQQRDGSDVNMAAPAPAPAPAAPPSLEAQPSKPLVREWLSERRVGHYQRTFTFPTDVDASAIRARLGQGLLRVLVPKVVRAGSRSKQVDIEDCEE